MRNTISYEWDYETVEDGDVLDHNHREWLCDFSQDDVTDTLVLVREEGNDAEGMTDRLWAYVKDGKLPEHFTDEMGNPISIKVPQRFHKELSDYLKKTAAI